MFFIWSIFDTEIKLVENFNRELKFDGRFDFFFVLHFCGFTLVSLCIKRRNVQGKLAIRYCNGFGTILLGCDCFVFEIIPTGIYTQCAFDRRIKGDDWFFSRRILHNISSSLTPEIFLVKNCNVTSYRVIIVAIGRFWYSSKANGLFSKKHIWSRFCLV